MLFVMRRLFFLLQSGYDFLPKNDGIHEGAGAHEAPDEDCVFHITLK